MRIAFGVIASLLSLTCFGVLPWGIVRVVRYADRRSVGVLEAFQDVYLSTWLTMGLFALIGFGFLILAAFFFRRGDSASRKWAVIYLTTLSILLGVVIAVAVLGLAFAMMWR